ncbi:hypothetical protein MBLNU230_g2144t1 [Neophaeotheca triangularis]
MLPSNINTPREATLYYDGIYDSLISTGQAQPFIYPWASAGAGIVILYLLIDHRRSRWLELLRFPVFVLLFAFSAWSVATNRARNPAASFGVGLISSWGTLWVSTFMVIRDCQKEFRRIEKSEAVPLELDESNTNGHTTSSQKLDSPQNGAIKQRHPRRTTSLQNADALKGPASRRGPLFWQAYPSAPFRERLDWIADIFCSFRGVGWSCQVSGIPPAPKWVQSQLEGHPTPQDPSEGTQGSHVGIKRYNDRSELLRTSLQHVATGIVVLDICKTIMAHDAYFWGNMAAQPPAYLPDYISTSYTLVKTYRLLVSLASIYTALFTIFKLGPLFFCGVLGPKWIGVRGEAWMQPDSFGSYQPVFDKGLAGWWGGWWHQTFRRAFEAPGTRILEATGIEPRSELGKFISLCVAFFLSGCLHACGSYTQLGDTRPLWGPMRFFLLQILGIMGQTYASQLLAKAGVTQMMPKMVRQLANFFCVHVWLYHTAPLLMDDFARGGIWLFEPLPFSPLRGLGLGAKDDGWYCWGDGVVFWRTGKHFWNTGLAF